MQCWYIRDLISGDIVIESVTPGVVIKCWGDLARSLSASGETKERRYLLAANAIRGDRVVLVRLAELTTAAYFARSPRPIEEALPDAG
jgi:hypothetical protein